MYSIIAVLLLGSAIATSDSAPSRPIHVVDDLQWTDANLSDVLREAGHPLEELFDIETAASGRWVAVWGFNGSQMQESNRRSSGCAFRWDQNQHEIVVLWDRKVVHRGTWGPFPPEVFFDDIGRLFVISLVVPPRNPGVFAAVPFTPKVFDALGQEVFDLPNGVYREILVESDRILTVAHGPDLSPHRVFYSPASYPPFTVSSWSTDGELLWTRTVHEHESGFTTEVRIIRDGFIVARVDDGEIELPGKWDVRTVAIGVFDLKNGDMLDHVPVEATQQLRLLPDLTNPVAWIHERCNSTTGFKRLKLVGGRATIETFPLPHEAFCVSLVATLSERTVLLTGKELGVRQYKRNMVVAVSDDGVWREIVRGSPLQLTDTLIATNLRLGPSAVYVPDNGGVAKFDLQYVDD